MSRPGTLGRLALAVLAAGLCGSCSPKAAPPPAEPNFRLVDVTAAAGLDFAHLVGKSRPLDILRTTGSGVAWLDYDGDGWPDLFCVNQDPQDAERPERRGCRLYRNRGDGTFEDVTLRSRLPTSGVDGYGVAVADYDGDGWPDIYVTCYGPNHLYHNQHDGTFVDVAHAVGVDDAPLFHGRRKWSTAAVWFDADGDGDLDLYVANYCDFEGGKRLCDINGVATACTPAQYSGQPDLFFLNQGNGKFVLDQRMFALGSRPPGRGLGALAFDADGDGRTDLMVANDGGGNFFFHNLGGRFEECGYRCGLALDGAGGDPAGMGLDAVDYDGDGHVDVALSNFQDQSNILYHGGPGLLFEDVSAAMGIGAATRARLAFGAQFVDLNLDGATELLFVNGHVQDNIARIRPDVAFAQRPQLFSFRNGAFAEVTDHSGPALQVPLVGRGTATCDYNRDGTVDLAVSTNGGGVRLWRNESPHGHWAQVRLHGRAPNTEAIGARVTLWAGGKGTVRCVDTGRSYLSDSERTLSFGLGAVTAVDRVEVRWPNGKLQSVPGGAADRRIEIRQEQ